MKLRLHNDEMKDDLAIVDACLKATQGKMTLMVDANQATNLPSPRKGSSGTIKGPSEWRRELEARKVLWLEEPLSRYDFRQPDSAPGGDGDLHLRR